MRQPAVNRFYRFRVSFINRVQICVCRCVCYSRWCWSRNHCRISCLQHPLHYWSVWDFCWTGMCVWVCACVYVYIERLLLYSVMYLFKFWSVKDSSFPLSAIALLVQISIIIQKASLIYIAMYPCLVKDRWGQICTRPVAIQEIELRICLNQTRFHQQGELKSFIRSSTHIDI